MLHGRYGQLYFMKILYIKSDLLHAGCSRAAADFEGKTMCTARDTAGA